MRDPIVNTLLELLARDQVVHLTGLGHFWRARHAAVTASDPRSGATISAPATVRVAFVPDPTLRGNEDSEGERQSAPSVDLAQHLEAPDAAGQLSAWLEPIVSAILNAPREGRSEIAVSTFGSLKVRWHTPPMAALGGPRRRFVFAPSPATTEALGLS